MEFLYEVTVKSRTELAARGRTVHAATDRGGKPCRVPDRIREVFA
jgi:acyl-CoA thioesterase FadM